MPSLHGWKHRRPAGDDSAVAPCGLNAQRFSGVMGFGCAGEEWRVLLVDTGFRGDDDFLEFDGSND